MSVVILLRDGGFDIEVLNTTSSSGHDCPFERLVESVHLPRTTVIMSNTSAEGPTGVSMQYRREKCCLSYGVLQLLVEEYNPDRP